MKVIAPRPGQLELLREIARAGFDHAATKRLCSAAGWQLVEDEPELGFIQYFLWVGPEDNDRRLLSVGTPGVPDGPHIYLPLYYFGEEGGDPIVEDCGPFDDAYQRLSAGISAVLGPAGSCGTYEHPHRPGWSYGFCTWRLTEANVFLLQDEHDIQFGMDVSLWFFPAELEVSVPLPF